MQFLNVSDMQAALLHTASVIIENEPMLTELDTRIGDGDHGIGMKAGFQALEAELSAGPKADFYSLFRESGITLLRAMGGASGVILCTLLLGGVDALRGIDEMDARMLTEFFEKGVEAVRRRGRARPGQKTMVDALVPAAESMRVCVEQGGDVSLTLLAGEAGAAYGAESTRDMMSRVGRSRNFAEETLGIPDPGAVSISLFFRGLSEWARKRT